MPAPKDAPLFLLLRCFTIFLLIGLLPVPPALAQSMPGAFGKSMPANGAQEQPTSLLLRWDSSNTATSYEYCIDTVDNDACDTTWESTGSSTEVRVNLAADTVYYWQVSARNGAGTAYADGYTWWSFRTGPESPLARKSIQNPSAAPEAVSGEAVEEADAVAIAGNFLQDPSFENSFPDGTYWESWSLNFGTALCTPSACGNGGGTAKPRTGNVWAWFGGIPATEQASVFQSARFPSCGASLQFYFWIGAATSGSDANDKFIITIDDKQVFTANATQRSLYPSYKLVTVNVNAFADGKSHRVSFKSYTTNQLITFNVDDVSLISGPCVTVSGKVNGAFVKLSYTNRTPQEVWLGSDGSYSFKVPLHWSGKVTPSGISGEFFSPPSRSYSNLTTNKTGQNYTAMYNLAGNVGVNGVRLSYTDGTPKTVTSQPDGNYLFRLPFGWNGTVTPSHPCFAFSPVSRSYDFIGNHVGSEDYTPTLSLGLGCADINAEIGGTNRGRYGLLPGIGARTSFAGLDSGPVKLTSTNTVPIIGAERLIYKANGVPVSFSEMIGMPANQLDNVYWLPWYNNKDLNTQLRFANVSVTDATIHISIGGIEVTGSPFILAPGASTRKSFAGIDKGPVKIESDVNIVASERVIYNVNGVDTSFTEMMAMPESKLDMLYWLPWYNSKDLDSQLRIANVSSTDATIHVSIGGTEVTGSPFILVPGASKRLSFPGIDKGPVKIESDVSIIASERVIYKVNGLPTSFSEMLAMPNNMLDMIYWLPWYNNKDLNTQLRFANLGTGEADIRVYIGGLEVETFPLAPGASIRKSYVGIDKGPVKIETDGNIVISERVIYTANGIPTSFSELMALPNKVLDPTYWLPWYNNKDLDTQLRFAVPQ